MTRIQYITCLVPCVLKVILPSLHISLGIFKKIYDLLESDCHSLDVRLFKLRVEGADEDDDDDEFNFDQAVVAEVRRQQELQHQLLQKRESLEELEEELPLFQLQSHPQAQQIHGEYREMICKAGQLHTDITELESRAAAVDLPFGTGPVACGLDTVLQKHNVCRQAYHGKSFVGNHVHKCCQVKVITDLTSVPRSVIANAKSEDISIAALNRLEREAAVISKKFEEVLLQFADVHHGINHSNPLTDDGIQQIDISIKNFMRCFRAHFPKANISPKMHLLEDHAVDQLRMFKVGFGLLNEQGGELVHTEFNRSGRVVQGMQDPLQKLLSVMRRHHTTTTPEIRAACVKKTCKEE
ncbi:uncharacterized protein LOC119732823 [Patiria miniata]|uniref:Uncharacterized protein n=1 Tax=Patiria miniata TaxID=46514 RepID=A0A914AF63_PATMI|nr:uncharacterized protein LOC119732823 [Patiria miniata]